MSLEKSRDCKSEGGPQPQPSINPKGTLLQMQTEEVSRLPFLSSGHNSPPPGATLKRGLHAMEGAQEGKMLDRI